MAERGRRGLAAAVLILALAGLVIVASGVAEAAPVIYTYSEQEQASVHHGRVVTAIGTVALLAAAGLLVLAPVALGAAFPTRR